MILFFVFKGDTSDGACAKANVPCSVCGEMAGRPLDALALAALGVSTLSMSAFSIGPVKAAVRVSLGLLSAYLEEQLQKESGSCASVCETTCMTVVCLCKP